MPEILYSKESYNGHIFKCIENQVKLDDGTIVQRNLVQKSPCVVALVRHIDTDEVYLAKEYRIGSAQVELGFVAGLVDEGEEPINAALRELREEVGFSKENVVGTLDLGYSFTSSGFTDEKIHYFYISVTGEPKEQQLDVGEKVEVVKVLFSDLPELVLRGDLNGNHAQVCMFRYNLFSS